MPARYEDAHCLFGEFREERAQHGHIGFVQNGESGKRAAFAAVKRRWNAPYAAATIAELCLLNVAVFLETVWWISHDRMDRVRRLCLHPRERIAVMNQVFARLMAGRCRCSLGGCLFVRRVSQNNAGDLV